MRFATHIVLMTIACLSSFLGVAQSTAVAIDTSQVKARQVQHEVLKKLLELHTVSYTDDMGQNHSALVLQELQKHLPQVIAKDSTGKQVADLQAILAVYARAIQELDSKVDRLQLENKVLRQALKEILTEQSKRQKNEKLPGN